MYFLLVRDSGREPAIRMQAQAGIEIGRSPDSQCVLGDPNVGRKAAKIVEERGVLYLEDMGSTNRTSIRGGRKLAKGEREPLRHGLMIDLGRSSIEIEEQVEQDKTDAGDATNPGQAEEDGFGDRTMVGSPPSDAIRRDAARPIRPAPKVEVPDDMLNTMRAPAAAPAPAPTPQPKRPAPAVQPPRAAPVAKPESATMPPAPVRTTPRPVPVTDASSHSGSTSEFLGPGGAGGGTQSIRPITGDLGVIGTMITRRPRLVIVNEADRRIVQIENVVTTIGRESGECRIDHKAISQPHAMIRFVPATNNFQIEDRKSKNQTFVGGLALNPEQPQLLAPECLVRFGPIEAVFVVARDSENAPIPPAQYAAAARYLVANHQATPEQIEAAQEQAKSGVMHVGEALMTAGVITARAWTKAFECGRSLPEPVPSKRRTGMLIVIAVVALAAVLAYVFRAQLGLGSK